MSSFLYPVAMCARQKAGVVPRVNGIVPVGGRSIYWQMQDLHEGNYEKLVVYLGAAQDDFLRIWEFGAIEWVVPPENLNGPWMFDQDRAREQVNVEYSSGFPEWARGKASAPPVSDIIFEITESEILPEPPG